MKELEEELSIYDQEYSNLERENIRLAAEQNHMKGVNKKLFERISNQAENTADEDEGSNEQEETIGEIHLMYQDLFLSDMKKEVEDAHVNLTNVKADSMSVSRDIAGLKKEQANLEATLK